MQRLRNRREAGRLLADVLKAHANEPDLVVLALPRGGVPVAFEVAKTLKAPLDVLLVRKLGVPGHEELAMGAVSNSGQRVLNEDVVAALEISPRLIERVTEHEKDEIKRREALYRKGKPPLNVTNKSVILIDDGLATGSTMLAGLRSLQTEKTARLTAAVPVSPPSTCYRLRDEADEVVCLMTPQLFFGVGQWYDDFSQTSDDEVITLLEQASAWANEHAPPANSAAAKPQPSP